MRSKHSSPKKPAEQVVKDIRRATRRHFSAEDKIRIVLEGLRGEDSIAELCRKEIDMKKKAVVYARVSTTRQADHDLSIPDQIAHAERYCEGHDIEIVGHYIDAGASARSDKRPEFQRMAAEIKSGLVQTNLVLVHSLSRFFRNSFGFESYSQEFAKNGVQIIAMTQEMGDGPQGKLNRQIMTSFDEYNSAETAKHVSRSMNENARRGFWNGSVPPFGYRTYVAEWAGAKAKKKLEIEPNEAEIVKLIFKLYVYGDGKSGPLGIKNTVSYLANKGLKLRNGVPFRVQIIQQMLRRTDYIGVHYFNRQDSRTKTQKPRDEWIEMPVPAIVDEELFHVAQAQLDARNPRMNPPRFTNSPVLLSGIAHCGQCGAPMRLRTGKYGKYRYYTCSKQVDQGKTACTGITIPEGKLDDVVIDHLCDRFLKPKRLKEVIGALTARNSGRRSRLQADMKSLRQKKRETERQLNTLVDAIENSAIGAASVVQQRFAKRQGEFDEILRLIALKERELNLPVSEVTQKRLQMFSDAMVAQLRDATSPNGRRAYLHLLLTKIVVHKDGIQISGSKAVLAQQLQTDKPVPPSMVPTFMDGWCTEKDSNLRPSDS